MISGWLLTVPSLFKVTLAEGVAWLWNQTYAFAEMEYTRGEFNLFLFLLFVALGLMTLFSGARALSKNRDSVIFLFTSLVSLAGTWLLLYFSLISSMHSLAWVLLVIVGIYIAFSYLGNSPSSLSAGFVMLLAWVFIQYLALIGNFDTSFALGLLALCYLFVAVMMYGLTQLHKATNHAFTSAYRSWTALYTLLFAYVLSFQTLLQYFWPANFAPSFGVFFFLLVIGFIALIAAVVGIMFALNARKLTGKEVIGFIALVILYIALISATSLIPRPETLFNLENQSISPQLFIVWILDNILFILVILAVVGYGVRYQSPDIVNLAILFFAADIITRYIGFIMDFKGQLGFAIISIIGGIILVVGGWGIENWRRRLVERTKQKTGEYAIY
jgi:hypothetical protein